MKPDDEADLVRRAMVASRMGGVDGNLSSIHPSISLFVASRMGGVDGNPLMFGRSLVDTESPPAWEAWIETRASRSSLLATIVASRMGGVDGNTVQPFRRLPGSQSPPAWEAWIETPEDLLMVLA